MLGTILTALVVGLLVALLGMVFDRTPDKRYAWTVGGVTALTIILVNIL